MSKFVDSVFSFLGRRSSKDQAAGDPVARRVRGGRKAVLKADSFVFLPGEGSGSAAYMWGELITPRTVGAPVSSYSDDYSVLSAGEKRKNVRSVLVDGSGKLVGRRLSGSFVAKAVRPRQTLDEVEDGSLEAFLREIEQEEDKYHTYDRAEAREEEESCTYDRLVHLPPARPREEGRRRVSNSHQLDLREGGRRRASSGGSAEHFHAVSAEEAGGERVDWQGLRETLEMTAVRGKLYIFFFFSFSLPSDGRSQSVKGAARSFVI